MTATIGQTTHYTSTFAGGDTLFAFAHPDDEFLTGGALALAVEHSDAVHTIMASDGEAGTRIGDSPLPLGTQRRHEAGRALGRYGVQAENQHYLELPDGKLQQHVNTYQASLAIGRLLIEHPIRRVVTLGHYGYDNHPDHIAVHKAAEIAVSAYAAANPGIRLLGLSRQDTPLQLAVDPVMKLKRLALHRTQTSIDLSDSDYQPVPGTIEQAGVRLSKRDRTNLAHYASNMDTERYEEYPGRRIAL